MSDKDALVFVTHILENIDKIESFSKRLNKERFLKDDLRQYALIRALEVIGEAVKNIPLSVKNKYPLTSWKEIIGTRDILIHHYFGVDLNIVWDIIKHEIPRLKQQIIKIKTDFEPQSARM